jgi:hypothetical protein
VCKLLIRRLLLQLNTADLLLLPLLQARAGVAGNSE